MIRKITIAFSIMFVVSSAGIAFAGDIYKWTDEDGNVHYGDRPMSEPSEEPLAVGSEPTDTSKDEVDNELIAAASEMVKPSPEEPHAQALEGEEKCGTYKARLRKLLASRRSYKDGENGERVYLDEDDIVAARERAQNQIEKYCDF